MASYEQQTTIDAPAQKVFDYVSDMTKHSEWGAHRNEITKTSEGPEGVGSTYATVAHQFGTQKEKSTVTDYEPGKLFAWDSTGALGTVHHWFSMAEEAGKTTVKKGLEVTKGSFLAKLFAGRIRRQSSTDLSRDLQRVKEHVEGSGSS